MQTGKQTDLLSAFWFGIFPGFQSSWRRQLYSTATKSIKMKYAYALLTQHNNETLLIIITLLILHPLNCAIANCLLPAMPSSTLLSLHCSLLSHTKTSFQSRWWHLFASQVQHHHHHRLKKIPSSSSTLFLPLPSQTINYTFTTATTIQIISSPKNIFSPYFPLLLNPTTKTMKSFFPFGVMWHTMSIYKIRKMHFSSRVKHTKTKRIALIVIIHMWTLYLIPNNLIPKGVECTQKHNHLHHHTSFFPRSPPPRELRAHRKNWTFYFSSSALWCDCDGSNNANVPT